MSDSKRFSHLKGDLLGGITATLTPLPKAMALGALVFAPLGLEYIPLGLVAGLVSLVVSNISGALVGGMPFMNNAPYSLSSFMLLGALQLIISNLGGVPGDPQQTFTALALLFLTVFTSGLFQILFGILRIGNFAKYIPYPVVAGLLNGSAILIAVSQLNVMLGLPHRLKLSSFVSDLGHTQVMTLLIGLVVCLSIWAGAKLNKKIPAPFYGIITGTATYYLCLMMGYRGSLGPVIGPIPGTVPLPRYAPEFLRVLTSGQHLSLIGDLTLMALGISAVVSLRSLVVCTAGETLTQERYNANRELMGQGVGNMLGGMFGGITTAGSLPSTLANYQYGGRTAFSRVVSGSFILLVLLFLHPLVAKLPTVVLAGILVMIALRSLDKWSLQLIPSIKPALAAGDNRPLINGLVVLLVTVTIVAFGIFEALAVGLAVSVFLFILQISKSIIRREVSGNDIRSNTQRAEKESALLEASGSHIQVLELEGSLFFGTADKIAARVEEFFSKELGFIIIDFKRISEIDSTGAKIMKQLLTKCLKHGLELYFSSVIFSGANQAHRELRNILSRSERHSYCFPDMEIALAVAEDRLLDKLVGSGRYDREIPVNEIDALKSIPAGELARIHHFFEKKIFKNQEVIVRQGDDDQRLFLIVRGRARVMYNLPAGPALRLGTLCPGTVFGEMAILDKGLRSADVIAVGNVTCYCLAREALLRINEEYPATGYSILAGLGKELATRLRLSNRIVLNLKT